MKRKKAFYALLIVCAALLALSAACFVTFRSLRRTLDSQRAAEHWAGDGGAPFAFAQLSCFPAGTDALSISDVYAFRSALTNELTEASLTVEDGRAFVDAWSAAGNLQVVGEHGSADAEITAVGGEYFLFHPLRLLSGGYIAEDDVMDDRVVLDRELAWRLFGGTDLTGLTVTIGPAATPFVVAGVVEREDDFASRKARGDGGMGLYMSYRAFSRLSDAGDGSESETLTAAPIACYELVTPQPVKGYAESFLRDNLKSAGEYLNNTDRFTVGSVWQLLREFGTRSMRLTDVVYPDWENAARCIGDWCALFLALAALFVILPAFTALVATLALLVRARKKLAKTLPAVASRAVDRIRTRRYRGAHEK